MTTPNMNDPDETLADALVTLRTASRSLTTPPGVEQALMAAFAREFPKKRWYQRLSVPQWGLAGALASGTGAMALLVFALGGPGRPAAEFDDGGDFIALESRERIALEAAPQLVQATLPRSALAGLPVALTPQTAGDSVRAEMLVGADGQALALRLLPE